jgi:hypothetical protein
VSLALHFSCPSTSARWRQESSGEVCNGHRLRMPKMKGCHVSRPQRVVHAKEDVASCVIDDSLQLVWPLLPPLVWSRSYLSNQSMRPVSGLCRSGSRSPPHRSCSWGPSPRPITRVELLWFTSPMYGEASMSHGPCASLARLQPAPPSPRLTARTQLGASTSLFPQRPGLGRHTTTIIAVRRGHIPKHWHSIVPPVLTCRKLHRCLPGMSTAAS